MIGENEHEPGVELGGFRIRQVAARFDQRQIGGIGISEIARR